MDRKSNPRLTNHTHSPAQHLLQSCSFDGHRPNRHCPQPSADSGSPLPVDIFREFPENIPDGFRVSIWQAVSKGTRLPSRGCQVPVEPVVREVVREVQRDSAGEELHREAPACLGWREGGGREQLEPEKVTNQGSNLMSPFGHLRHHCEVISGFVLRKLTL